MRVEKRKKAKSRFIALLLKENIMLPSYLEGGARCGPERKLACKLNFEPIPYPPPPATSTSQLSNRAITPEISLLP